METDRGIFFFSKFRLFLMSPEFCYLLIAATRILAVLKFFSSGTTLESINVKFAKAAVDNRNVSAEVVFADKPEKKSFF